MDTTTMVLLGLGGVAVLFLVMNANKTAAAPIVVHTPSPSNSAATAAEIAAGAAVVTSALNDFASGDDSSS